MPRKFTPPPIREKRNNLTCLGEAPRKNKRRKIYVVCDCGKETTIDLGEFGRQKTCGACFEDNVSEYYFYQTWNSVIQRCYNIASTNYKNYGARGIRVQENWINNPRAFCEYLETLPHAGEPGYTLDRIDNDGSYCEGNLRFATKSEQNLNQRISSRNTSGVKGVSYDKSKDKWLVYYKKNYLGRFQYFLEAVFARKAAEG